MTRPEPKVEVININEHYVVFEGGAVAPIETYLDIEDCVLDEDESGLAYACWCKHPDLGFVEVVIYEADETTRLQ